MNTISLQMIDHSVSSLWWKSLVQHFVQIGDIFEIRCWKEETDEIHQASMYGKLAEDKNEISIKGFVSAELLMELLSEEPNDKTIYNKMTKYFTINIEKKQYSFCSAHYGTEIYIIGASDDDISFFQEIMESYSEYFSIHITRN